MTVATSNIYFLENGRGQKMSIEISSDTGYAFFRDFDDKVIFAIDLKDMVEIINECERR